MRTVEVNVIKSEEGLLKIREALQADLKSKLFIKELSTGKTWENIGGFNGNFWDLWLRKVGTFGQTKKTFIRVCVQNYRNIAFELRFLNIPTSESFKEELQKEMEALELKESQSKDLILNFSDVNKAIEWLNNDEGNSHKRRTRWANRAERLGASRGYGNLLRNVCEKLSSNN